MPPGDKHVLIGNLFNSWPRGCRHSVPGGKLTGPALGAHLIFMSRFPTSWKLILPLTLSKVCSLGPQGPARSSPGPACARPRLMDRGGGGLALWTGKFCTTGPAQSASSSRGLYPGRTLAGGTLQVGSSHLCQRLLWRKDPIQMDEKKGKQRRKGRRAEIIANFS